MIVVGGGFSEWWGFFVGSITVPNERISAAKLEQIASMEFDWRICQPMTSSGIWISGNISCKRSRIKMTDGCYNIEEKKGFKNRALLQKDWF